MTRGILLTISSPQPSSGTADLRAPEDLTEMERMDEVVVSAVRAAAAAQMPVYMPYEQVFAPLAASVLTQYAAPKVAESLVAIQLAGSEAAEPAPLTLVAARPSRWRPRRPAPWLRLAIEAGVVAPAVDPLEQTLAHDRIAVALLLGKGRGWRTLVRRIESSAPNVKICALGELSPHDSRVTFIDEEVEGALEAGRGKRRDVELGESDRWRRDVEASSRMYRPYSLVAQAVVAPFGRRRDMR